MRKELVDQLIQNKGTKYDEGDRAWLEALDDKQGEKLVPVEVQAPAPLTNEQIVAKAKELGLVEKPADDKGAIQALSAEDRAALDFGKRTLQERRDALVGKITANAACKFTAEQLRAKDLPELEMLAELAAASAPEYGVRPAANAHPDGVGEKVEGLPTMTINWAKEGAPIEQH